jgi:predicted dehydrogenase
LSAIRWGFLGTSGILRERWLPAFGATSFGVPLTVGSRSLGRAQAVAAEFGIERAVGSYAQVLEDPAVDAVYISLPNTMHREWIMNALEAGKPVLSEKPMTTSAAEAAAVLEASRRTGLPVMEGLMYRFHPQNRYARELVRSGSLGAIREVRVHFAYRLMDALQPDNIRLTDGVGAGSLMDMGCYVISAARMLFEDEPISAAGYWDIDDDSGIDVGFAGTLEFSDTRFAPVSWSFRTGYGAGCVVVGSEATLEVPHAFIPQAAGRAAETVAIMVERSSRRTEKHFAPADHFALMIDEFSSAVAEGRAPLYEADDAYRQALAMDLVTATRSGFDIQE